MQLEHMKKPVKRVSIPYFVRMREDFAGWCAYNLRRLLLLAGILYICSVMYPITRLYYLLTLLWALLTVGVYFVRLARKRRRLYYFPALAIVCLAAWVCLADRPPDTAHLRLTYRACLLSFRGVHYVWGGETHIGIDCSGLARTAFADAMVVEGLREGNPRLLGPMLWRFWWRDLSARAMGEDQYHYTRRIGAVKRLAGLGVRDMQVGDLAVTRFGDHVLIYLGDQQWIEANPADGGVVVHRADRQSTRPYFGQPMTIERWAYLD